MATAAESVFLEKEKKYTEKITLNLVINGRGTVWIGDVALSQASLD